MVDQWGKAWLIEVNRNPCLETSTSLLCRVISNMVEQSFRIALDPIFMVEDLLEKNPAPDAFQANSFRLIYETVLAGEAED